MKNESKALYINARQKEFLQGKQRTKLFLAGRGTGKSTCIGFGTRMRAQSLPRAKIFFASTTYNQILTKTLPAIEDIWMTMGMIDGVHYVIGKRPPKHFVLPYKPPRKYENIITFMNGFTVEMLSMDRANLARGGNYDGGEIDEAALIKAEDYRQVLVPSIRGNIHRFASYHHQQVGLYTSIPWKPSGYWIFDFEEKAKSNPESFLVVESTSFDNIHALGEQVLRNWEEEMDYLEYQIEVMNQRIVRLPNGFYNYFDDKKHLYKVAFAYDDSDNNWRETKITCIDPNYRHDELLDLSFDFSGWFNCCWAFQARENHEYAINSFFVKGEEKLQELVEKVCEHYKTHKYRLVRLWGEPRGHDKLPMTPTIFESLKGMFEKKGWGCEVWAPPGHSASHSDRHQFMGDLMQETRRELPRLRINEETCKAPVIAIQTTDITTDFRKDKSMEKDRKARQEHAPHFTDALDYYFVAKYGQVQFGSDDGDEWFAFN